ncbi:MAG: c-type cytochrome [Rhodospirillales bacterium]
MHPNRFSSKSRTSPGASRRPLRGRRQPALATIAAVAAAVVGLAAGVYFLIMPAEETRLLAGLSGDAGLVALGQRVYVAHCASCHGDRLQGQPEWQTRKPDGKLPAPPHDVSGHTWHHGDEQLFKITKHGLKHLAPLGYFSDMPAYEGMLSDGQIWAVLAFIKKSWPEEVRERQARMSRRQ